VQIHHVGLNTNNQYVYILRMGEDCNKIVSNAGRFSYAAYPCHPI